MDLALINKKIFKAYDIRGRYPDELNERTAEFIAAGIKKIFQYGKVVIAHDARLSSPALYKAIINGLKKEKILKVGMATTPMFYFLVNHFKAGGGIMITASHNPKEYNGLKIVGKNAALLSGVDILNIILRKKEVCRRDLFQRP